MHFFAVVCVRCVGVINSFQRIANSIHYYSMGMGNILCHFFPSHSIPNSSIQWPSAEKPMCTHTYCISISMICTGAVNFSPFNLFAPLSFAFCLTHARITIPIVLSYSSICVTQRHIVCIAILLVQIYPFYTYIIRELVASIRLMTRLAFLHSHSLLPFLRSTYFMWCKHTISLVFRCSIHFRFQSQEKGKKIQRKQKTEKKSNNFSFQFLFWPIHSPGTLIHSPMVGVLILFQRFWFA